ncbi:hypothetical protein IW140_003280 [Coemansia sp. RSA 1813]|nr:hypothetical protein IW138_003272 [Coemansia sp. RSA 986]KAJ2569188.1 hypothetical protein IW140_003280 [Coemansia sp. RSA 1813]
MLVSMAGTAMGDIVLSVASPSDMGEYMGVLSNAWPTLYPKLEEQLHIAAEEVPAEYSYLWSILSVTDAVPSTYNVQWAQAFVENAQALGPTTIVADDIPGAESDPGAQLSQIVSTNADGIIATATDVPVGHPTIIVAINGNVQRNIHDVQSGSSSDESGSEALDESLLSEGSSTSSGTRTFLPSHLLAVAAAGIGAIGATFF